MKSYSRISYMPFIAVLFSLVLVPGWFCTPSSSGSAKESSGEEGTKEWTWLFNGESLSAWRGYNQEEFPNHGWKITPEGYLQVGERNARNHTRGGDIVTRKSYGNFELILDFMLQDSSNSGIFYLVKEEAGAPIWHNAPEYQLLDDSTYASMGFTSEHFTAANYALHRPAGSFLKPVGVWNTARILVQDRKVEHWLNGQLAVQYELGSPAWQQLVSSSKFSVSPSYGMADEGPIGLQDHGQLVLFRDIRIRSL